jgi:hypothetical protein
MKGSYIMDNDYEVAMAEAKRLDELDDREPMSQEDIDALAINIICTGVFAVGVVIGAVGYKGYKAAKTALQKVKEKKQKPELKIVN